MASVTVYSASSGLLPCLWQDDRITLAGRGDTLTCTHGSVVLLLSGRLIGNRNLSPPDILEAYRRWGNEFPRHLLGDFAIALWDSEERRLVLARDVAGSRPLHYWVRG